MSSRNLFLRGTIIIIIITVVLKSISVRTINSQRGSGIKNHKSPHTGQIVNKITQPVIVNIRSKVYVHNSTTYRHHTYIMVLASLSPAQMSTVVAVVVVWSAARLANVLICTLPMVVESFMVIRSISRVPFFRRM